MSKCEYEYRFLVYKNVLIILYYALLSQFFLAFTAE